MEQLQQPLIFFQVSGIAMAGGSSRTFGDQYAVCQFLDAVLQSIDCL